jgi:hypothetical protein
MFVCRHTSICQSLCAGVPMHKSTNVYLHTRGHLGTCMSYHVPTSSFLPLPRPKARVSVFHCPTQVPLWVSRKGKQSSGLPDLAPAPFTSPSLPFPSLPPKRHHCCCAEALSTSDQCAGSHLPEHLQLTLRGERGHPTTSKRPPN